MGKLQVAGEETQSQIPMEITPSREVPASVVADAIPAPAEVPAVKGDRLSPDILTSPEAFVHLQRVAKMYAASSFVPERYGNPADCAIALHLSHKLDIDPIFFMQRSYPVGNGKFGIEAQVGIALCNRAKIYESDIQYDLTGEGDTRKCKAWGKRIDTGVIESAECSIKMAKEAGWYGKNGSWWPKLPDHMLCLRSATFLLKRYHPECLMGMDTIEEVRDIGGIQVIGRGKSRASELKAAVTVEG